MNKPNTTDEKRLWLISQGFICGKRDPRLNTKYSGTFMVVEDYQEYIDAGELPTEDGSNGPWCIVGNDLNAMVEEAFNVWWDDLVELPAILAKYETMGGGI